MIDLSTFYISLLIIMLLIIIIKYFYNKEKSINLILDKK